MAIASQEAGEIVWATFGNYLENRSGDRKMRPAVILRVGSPQHYIAGITSQRFYKHDGSERIAVPYSITDKQSYLWSPRMARLCRIDVRDHIGWITLPLLESIALYMNLPREMVMHLRSVAIAHRERPEWLKG
jgi:hypothetical protein